LICPSADPLISKLFIESGQSLCFHHFTLFLAVCLVPEVISANEGFATYSMAKRLRWIPEIYPGQIRSVRSTEKNPLAGLPADSAGKTGQLRFPSG
jgi:hypothetical protein